MFGLFGRRSLEDMLDKLSGCGIRLREGAGPDALLRDTSRFEAAVTRAGLEAGGFLTVLIAMGDEGTLIEPGHSAAINVSILPPPSDDVWHFDAECIEDHGDYKWIVERLCTLSGGDLHFDAVADYVDVAAGEAWLELDQAGTRVRLDLRVHDDWADEAVFAALQQRLAATGSPRRFAMQGLGQDALLVCLPPDRLRALNKLTGMQFQIIA